MVDPGIALLVFAALTAVALVTFWPGRGVVSRIARSARASRQVRLEDALKHVYVCERLGRACSLESLAGQLAVSTAQAAGLVSVLTETGLIRSDADSPELTEEGRSAALHLVRTHRLWERYLADRTGVPPGEWHDRAERMEHALSSQETDELAARLGHPVYDPHGDPIPTAAGDLPPRPRDVLASADAGSTVEILHLEDEPKEIYERLLALDFAPGERLEVRRRTPGGVRVAWAGREVDLDAVAARNVTVRLVPGGDGAGERRETLADAAPGETVRVLALSPTCQGAQRRRLLDLGVVRGTLITPELVSAAGDPVAYRIRGALIALRREQASWIVVSRDVGSAEVA